MSSSDPSPPFVHLPSLPNGTDSMVLWPQFPIDNESNFHIDYPPPFKRPKILDENYLPSTPFPPMSSRITRTNPVVNQPTGRIFFKTRPCTKFRMGQCRNGENCNFAHGEEDLRKPPPNWQELVPGRADGRGVGNGGNWEDDDKIIHRMKICKKFYSGEECPYGDKCNFLHKEPARFRDPLPVRNRDNAARESSAISIGTLGPPMAQPPICGIDQYTACQVGEAGYDASRGNLRSTYFKTKFCAKWETTGHCPFGEKCHFVHGHAELQLGGHPGDELAVSISGAPKPIVPAPVTDPVGTANKADATWPAQNQEGQRKNNCLLKWKATKKISRIYGDWIDDLPLNLPNEIEN